MKHKIVLHRSEEGYIVAGKKEQNMNTVKAFVEQYLVDEQGNRKAVVVPISAWEEIVESLDELDDIRAYDEAKREPSDSIPFEDAVAEIGKGTSG